MTEVTWFVRVDYAKKDHGIFNGALACWKSLVPQRIWGFPRSVTRLETYAEFKADIDDPRTQVYIVFLYVIAGAETLLLQLGNGKPHVGQGPRTDGPFSIKDVAMDRFRNWIDQWFEWQPIFSDAASRNYIESHKLPDLDGLQGLMKSKYTPAWLSQNANGKDEHVVTTDALRTLLPTIQLTRQGGKADPEKVLREQIQSGSRGFLYLIHIENTSFYKIGSSVDPELRIRTLQTGNPLFLQLVKTQIVENMRRAEAVLHKQFVSQKISNPRAREWFDLMGNQVQAVLDAFGRMAPDDQNKTRQTEPAWNLHYTTEHLGAERGFVLNMQ